MLFEDGVRIIKFWFSISKDEQAKRFLKRETNKLKQWKLSPVDKVSQEKWEECTHYKEHMFSKTHNSFSPWMIIKTNNKMEARLESMRYVLSQFDYDGKAEAETTLHPDPNVVHRYHRSVLQLDL
jgi:polyphosphate kinase 2 (PPK2 family)